MVDAEKRVLDFLDMDGLVNCLRGLIAVPSVGGQETTAQRYFAAEMLRIGLDVNEWEIDFDRLREHPAYSMSILRKEGIGVIGEYGGTKKSLMLNGHIDVVSPGEVLKWRYPPWSGAVADGRVHGRGSADMKGGLVCALYAIKAVIDSDFPLKGKVLLSSVIGEEDGGIGALDMILHGYHADAAIIPEPSDLDAAPAHAGVMAFRVTVQGKASHASLRDEGINAIEKAIPLLDALKKLESRRTARIKDSLYSGFKIPSPLSIGKIQGGEWPGTVAENLYFEGRVGVHTDETCEMVRKQIESTVAKAANQDLWLKEHRPVVEWNGYRFDPGSISTDHPIVETVKRAYGDVTGSAPLVSGKTYSSDMRLLINYGQIPTMIFGPGEIRQAHSANESISIDSLEKAAKTIVLTIMRWCI